MELNDFVRTYFKAAIHEGNRQAVKKDWDKVVLGLGDEQTQAQDEATQQP